MPTVRLTTRSISEIPLTEQGQILYRDALLTGFGLRVGTRSKAYFVEGQVNRRTVRATIGRADLFSPEVARRKALTILGEMVEGNDPNAGKHQLAAGGLTLEDAFTTFFEARAHLSPRTVEGYGRTPRLYLKGWAKRPLRELTRQMVLKRHQEIAKLHGPPPPCLGLGRAGASLWSETPSPIRRRGADTPLRQTPDQSHGLSSRREVVGRRNLSCAAA